MSEVVRRPKLFGSRRRTEVLLLVAILEESYPRELARLLGAPLMSVQKVVNALELEGVLATRLIGTERRVTLNPRYFAAKPLKQLLAKLAEGERELAAIVGGLRRRPRRAGKPL